MKTIKIENVTNKVRNMHRKALEIITDQQMESYFYTLEEINKLTKYEDTIGDDFKVENYLIPTTFGKLISPLEVKVSGVVQEIDLLVRRNFFQYNQEVEVLRPEDFNTISDLINSYLAKKLKGSELIQIVRKAERLEVARTNHVGDNGCSLELEGMPIELSFTGVNPMYYSGDLNEMFDLWLLTEVFNQKA